MSAQSLRKIRAEITANNEAAEIQAQLEAARLAVENAAILEAAQATERVDLVLKHRAEFRAKQLKTENELQKRILQEQTRELEVQKKLATKDALTGLDNRRAFNERAAELESDMMRHPELQASVAMIDLDQFKQINDMYGHDVGDKVLARTGQIIQENTRATDEPARYGGEELAILLRDANEADTLTFIDHIRDKISTDPELRAAVKDERLVTISAGVAQVDHKNPDVFKAIKQADEALYSAKSGNLYQTLDPGDPRALGRNQVVAYSQLPQAA